jgi:hypothetical protein
VRRTVPPSAEIEEQIDRLLAVGVGENPRGSLSELAKLGARLIIQRAEEDEFDAWLGRARYARRPDGQRGLRNGFRPRRVQIANAEDGLALVVSGRAIATVAGWVPDGLAHPGVIAVPLVGGPSVATRLVWRSNDDRPDRAGAARSRARVDGRAAPQRRRVLSPARGRSRPSPSVSAESSTRHSHPANRRCRDTDLYFSYDPGMSARLPGRRIRGSLQRSGDCFVRS